MLSERPTRALIDIAALKHNLAVAHERGQGARTMAVVKADAYGHGLEMAAAAFDTSDELAVVSLEDALRLRQAGINKTITLLSGFYSSHELADLIEYQITVVIYTETQLAYLTNIPTNKKLRVWLKVDSGMGRSGISKEQFHGVCQELVENNSVNFVGVLSHFANADEPVDAKNDEQTQLFCQLTESFSGLERSLANSAALLSRQDCQFDMVRPGLMLYGASPISNTTAADFQLRPAMTFASKIIAVKEIKQGETVGYGGLWRSTKKNTRVGLVPCGYGDGYPRHAPTGTPILINGQRSQLLGRVSMDLITVDLSVVRADVGSEVVLWGVGLPVEEIALHAGTIAYELMCGVAARVHRQYSNT